MKGTQGRRVEASDPCTGGAQRRQVLASPASRFLANLVDCAVLVLPFLVGWVILLIDFFIRGDQSFGIAASLTGMLGMLGSGVACAYQLFLAATARQSLGKRWQGIQVVRGDGTPVGVVRLLLLRNGLWWVLTGFTGGISGLIDVLFIFDRDRRCLHDLIADTQVIQLPRLDPAAEDSSSSPCGGSEHPLE